MNLLLVHPSKYHYFQYFSKRNPKSNWSRVNKEKIERLLEANKMMPVGLEMVAHAKASGTWTALDDVENLILPAAMQAQMEAAPEAFKHWEAFPRSVKRGILEWIYSAKTEPTRLKRIRETIEKAARNERANQYRRWVFEGKTVGIGLEWLGWQRLFRGFLFFQNKSKTIKQNSELMLKKSGSIITRMLL